MKINIRVDIKWIVQPRGTTYFFVTPDQRFIDVNSAKKAIKAFDSNCKYLLSSVERCFLVWKKATEWFNKKNMSMNSRFPDDTINRLHYNIILESKRQALNIRFCTRQCGWEANLIRHKIWVDKELSIPHRKNLKAQLHFYAWVYRPHSSVTKTKLFAFRSSKRRLSVSCIKKTFWKRSFLKTMTLRKSCDFSVWVFFLTKIQNDRCLLRLQREISVFKFLQCSVKFDTDREVGSLSRNMLKDRADIISPKT